MRKIILFGRSGCGKTTLTQALRGQNIVYHKTQYINHYDAIIDTPGEYAENRSLGSALAIYSYEADVVGFLLSAIEPYSIFPPNIAPCVNREVVGIVTQIDRPDANVKQAEYWLKLAGCKTIFDVSSYTRKGLGKILNHLKEEGDSMCWDDNGILIQ